MQRVDLAWPWDWRVPAMSCLHARGGIQRLEFAIQGASIVTMKSPARSVLKRFFVIVALLTIASSGGAAFAQQSNSTEDDGLLGDDFARDTGAIIVTANRLGRGNLFEAVETPEDSCLAKAPGLGESEPGFTIDASGMRRLRDLEKVRRSTRAGTIFVSGGSFVGADFRRAKLYDMCFFSTDLSQTNWSGLSAAGLGFVGVDLTGADMSQTQLPFVLFRNARLGLVNARGADWQNGRIDGGWEGSLRELDLAGADLTGFEIVCGTSAEDGCPTERGGIDLTGANLRRASFHSFYVSDIELADARIDQTEMALDHLVFLDDARLVGPIVLRSPRRAIMLFPGEAKQLADADEVNGEGMNVCGEAISAAEQIICDAPGSAPRTLLQSVAQLEQQASGSEGYAERHEAWKASRDACLQFNDGDQRLNCISQLYTAREAELRSGMGAPGWIEPGSYRLFLSREAAYPTRAAQPGLYGRILPILLDSAVAAVIVRANGDGKADTKGMTADGCFFEADDLAYDADAGALAFWKPGGRRKPPVMEEPLLALSGDQAEVIEAGLARAGDCASDDPFPMLEEIELGGDLLATVWERF